MDSAGIYISIPFCAQKCTYCNFRSGVHGRTMRESYLRFLAREIGSESLQAADTLYLGGGSPSLLESGQFAQLASSLPPPRWEEATIEVAPGEAPAERILAWVKAGINRASLGVQSFSTKVAGAAGRRHDAGTVQSDVRRLANHGIRNVSIDLIAGLAHQTEKTWRSSLEWIERLDVDHVSVYMLERDDESRLGRELRAGGHRYGASVVPAEDRVVDFYLAAVERLRCLGLERYEVSNFARPGRQSLHNRKYWRMKPYFGFGSDAHSFNGTKRWANVNSPGEYVRRMAEGRSPRSGIEDLDTDRLLEDRVLTGLRTTEGVVLDPAGWRKIGPRARLLGARRWIEANEPSIRLTDEGLLFADEAVAELLG